ncbi:MAG: hypothetical protein QGH57_02925 [Candidatus Thalassarchaeaceae archaeon]|nr:hypothetical protein [Candidatus Thalassarchaeaceae archaeon]MDP7649998.1 hypothetical protein [Candidatus Thalassarchaeaceae archaeon]HJM77721.1 hypothetical protein [Candidatus Thalassarchaeaceae archaeon]
MSEESEKQSLDTRLRGALDKLDEGSKKVAESTKEGFNKAKGKVKEKSDSIDAKEMMNRTRKGISSMNERISSAAERADVKGKATKSASSMFWLGSRLEALVYWLMGSMQYLIPATIIFQSCVWLAYLSEGSSSHDFVSQFSDGMAESDQLIWTVISLFGAAAGYLMAVNFDSTGELIEPVGIAPVYDILVILLLTSSVLYLLKSSKSLYYLSLAFGGSVVVRLLETSIFDYNWLLMVLSVVGLVGFFSTLSLPFLRNRFSPAEEAAVPFSDSIDLSGIISHEFGEPSYPTLSLGDLDLNMEDIPLLPPKRPSRRSEYELYEWVCLMANFILWPTTLVISVVLGSGVEMYGTAFSMESNSMMLFGPAAMTAFFFIMLYRMDANARDGSLYAAQKQAYLDEMEKFTEAKRAYLELVTLQAEIRKEQLREENPDLSPTASDS